MGDRIFTDTVYGNRNGFLTILTKPLSLAGEPFIVKQVELPSGCFSLLIIGTYNILLYPFYRKIDLPVLTTLTQPFISNILLIH